LKTYPDTKTVDYVYDLEGEIQQVNDPTGMSAFAYDTMGRLIGTTTKYTSMTSRHSTNPYATTMCRTRGSPKSNRWHCSRL